MKISVRNRLFQLAAIAAAGIAAWFFWQTYKQNGLPQGFAGGNGRVESSEINIAAKTAGRISEILVNEGDFITAGEILARMDTAVLDAQFREATAQLDRAVIGVDTAKAQVKQRLAELDAAKAVVLQRKAELDAAQKQAERTRELVDKGTTSQQTLDEDIARYEGAKAAVSAAEAQVAGAEAAIGYAESQVVAAESSVEAARATLQRIEADIDDSVLKSPRDGRVQYRVAQPGEVLTAGGVVLNMVDLKDVYMTFFLPTEEAGQVAIGSEARIVLDAAPQYVIPARVSLVSDVAQFTPKTVETAVERQKLMFRIKARVNQDVLKDHIEHVKTGLPGMAYVRLNPSLPWPADLQPHLPE
ncbi:HlyD family secretion protein [Roseibium aggregatum]|uniref:HlyD family efflux transporter periplasmic adaptor subunit n=1 Tax=Roseibium aggregatum TaxID=187304 RepID=A0A939EAN3_9HYPH|nr:HlyD family efflux transporter periplasmic adaptor subunit [Roseibium aggregatum]MBN9668959.1 HlyD family efflux transporter periplasmic adaptor subunit [Roseibium aggregatum]